MIETPPEDRMAIKTYLLGYDEATICEAIARELDRGGQVFFVHNRVKDIDMLAGRFRRLMPFGEIRRGPRATQGAGTGKDHAPFSQPGNRRPGSPPPLSNPGWTFHRLIRSSSTTPTGSDWPRSINSGGRVGRSSEQAYAYLLVSNPQNLTRDARKRPAGPVGFYRPGSRIQDRVARSADQRGREFTGGGPVGPDRGGGLRHVRSTHGTDH